MSIALLVMTDGRRELLEHTLCSFREKVTGDISVVYVNDDSGDREYWSWLSDNLKRLVDTSAPIVVFTSPERSGFGGAIRNAWSKLLLEYSSVFGGDFDWVFHLEDDFLFNYRVDLAQVQQVMVDYPYLAQMALKRQPWGSDLPYANGFMEAAPDWYQQREDAGACWVETRRNWTTNPSLFRAELLAGGWPGDPHSEGKFGFQLKEHGLPWGIPGEDVHFGIWGRIEDPPLVHHIGDYRVGDRY